MTKLSIIVPIYRVAQYLCKCVDSLLVQDLPSSEYEVPQICDSYADIYDNIRVVHRENGGLSAARNSGIEVAQGEYIMFVDSDDYVEPKVLGGLMEQMERDKLDVLRYRLQYVLMKDEGVNGLKYEWEYEVFNPYKIDPFKGNDYSEIPTDGVTFLNERMNTQCYAWAFIIKRGLIVEGGKWKVEGNCLFTPGIYFEDTDWTPRMLVRAKRVASTKMVVYNYLMREGSITNAVNRSKQKKVLDDKIRLVETLQRQANEMSKQGKDNRWFARMVADTVISIITILSTQFYSERKEYLAKLKALNIYPIQSRVVKARLINISPKMAIIMMHYKNLI